ncbi:MAG: glycosyltransferase family 2 protein [Thermodesulfobacteriota bacterium]
MPRVNVIIPNLNGEKLFPICLESLKKQGFRDFDITVVDNGSEDGSLTLLKDRYPEVRLISLDKNYGFAGGVNRGIEATEGEFIALLNNDIEVDPKWLEELHRALIEHPEVGSCQAKLLRYQEREKINGLGIRMNIDGEVEIIGWKEIDQGQYEEERYIFAVGAGASLYRRKMFEDIGLFDENFFANFEDVDLSFRAQLAGYKALYVPKAIGYHMIGATIKKMKYLPTYLNNRNKILFFWKNMPNEMIKRHFWRIFWSRSSFFFKRILFNFYKLRTYYFLKGVFAAYFRLPYILKERKRIKAMRRVSIDYLDSIMDKDFI